MVLGPLRLIKALELSQTKLLLTFVTAAKEPAGAPFLPTRRGFYFTISSKLSNLFDLFGTSKAGLAESRDDQANSKQKHKE